MQQSIGKGLPHSFILSLMWTISYITEEHQRKVITLSKCLDGSKSVAELFPFGEQLLLIYTYILDTYIQYAPVVPGLFPERSPIPNTDILI